MSTALAAVVVGAGLVLVACGSESGKRAADTSTTASTATTATTTPVPTLPATAAVPSSTQAVTTVRAVTATIEVSVATTRTTATRPTTTRAPTTTTINVREFIANRGPLPSCGSYTLLTWGPTSTINTDQATVDDCILDAFEAGRPAEVVITRPDGEGNTIVTYYRVLGPGRVELIRDFSACTFGCGVPLLANECSTLRIDGEGPDAVNCYK
jgi:hypothetical protein